MLLEQLAPAPDASSRHAIRIAAPPAHVYHVARTIDLDGPLLIRVLMGLRMTAARRRPSTGPAFTLVAETPGEEFVLGIMGRFWTLTPAVVPASADCFRAPPPSGLAQGLWNFRVTPIGRGTELSTETRVRCGDAESRRKFLRYWRVIRVGSGLIRGSMLRHIRATAERTARDLDAGADGADIPT